MVESNHMKFNPGKSHILPRFFGKIILNENNKCVSNDKKLYQINCGYISNMISELQILSISENISNVTDITDPVLTAVNMFQNHPSIKNIRAKNFKSVFLLLTLTK